MSKCTVTASAVARPTSPWMSFTSLIRELSKHLTPLQMALIKKQYKDFKVSRCDHSLFIYLRRMSKGEIILRFGVMCIPQERKITRQDMIQVVRRTAGDGMLSGAIKSFYRGMVCLVMRLMFYFIVVYISSNYICCLQLVGSGRLSRP